MPRTGIPLLAALLAWSAGAVPSDPDPSIYFQRGMTRMAAGKLRHALEERPDDVLLMSMYAINWARAGFYADAVAAFALCAGSPLYEQEGILLHADALRETGTPRAAARLRLSQRVDTTSLSDELTILLGAADDLIAAGALDEASAILQEAEGLAPRSVTVHTALAELAESQGDDTSAGFHRWLASLQPQTRSLRARTDEIQLLLEAGELEAAADAIETARAAQPQALRLVALQARLLRLESRTQEALYLLSLPRWSFTERPDLRSEEARVLSALNRHTEASELLDRLLVLYPGSPEVLAAKQAIRPR